MPAKRIVACLDVRGGRVVKGVRFSDLRDAGDPAELALRYCTQGADEIVMLDVSATLEQRLATLETVRVVAREIDVPLTVGGGVRGESDAVALLAAGADKIAINSGAVEDPHLLRRLANRFGSQSVVLAVDTAETAGGWEVVTRSATRATQRDALEWAVSAAALGAGELLLTAIDRDGTRNGFDVRAIATFSAALPIPLVASGGANDEESFADAFAAGADAALGASIFHYGDATIGNVKHACAVRGWEIRL